MSKIVPIRLNDSELQMLDEILSSEHCESENRSEWFRLLLHREDSKRKRLGVPRPEKFQSSFRTGAPRWGSERYNQLRARRVSASGKVSYTEVKRNAVKAGAKRNTVKAGEDPGTRSDSQIRIKLFSSSTRVAKRVLIDTKK